MKMTTRITGLVTVLAITSTLTFIGCQKQAEENKADDKTFVAATAESDAEAEVVFEDVFDNVVGTNDEVGMSGTGVFGSANNSNADNVISGAAGADTVSACFTVSVKRLAAPNAFPVQITLDFGTGCTGRDGRTRKGKIITEYTNRLVVPGAKATTTFDGYYVNNIKVEGTQIITNKSTANALIFQKQVLAAKLTKPNGNFTDWSCDKTLTQLEGLGTPYWPFDDAFSITGQANGSASRNGQVFQWAHIISKPLIKKFACRWLSQGEITIQRSNRPVGYLDFGAGSCDNKATVTVNGVSVEITLY